ncbi:MAG: hypothetical protein ACYSUQ_14915, partial [Planctomycetota bacterium]
RENRRLRHYEIRLPLESNLDRGAPEEKRIISHLSPEQSPTRIRETSNIVPVAAHASTTSIFFALVLASSSPAPTPAPAMSGDDDADGDGESLSPEAAFLHLLVDF